MARTLTAGYEAGKVWHLRSAPELDEDERARRRPQRRVRRSRRCGGLRVRSHFGLGVLVPLKLVPEKGKSVGWAASIVRMACEKSPPMTRAVVGNAWVVSARTSSPHLQLDGENRFVDNLRSRRPRV